MNTVTQRIGQCPDRTPGLLTIVNGQAQHSGFSRTQTVKFEGTIGPQGQLAMRSGGRSPSHEIIVSGRIDGNGAVRGGPENLDSGISGFSA